MAVIDNKRYVYIGIDFTETYAMVSYMADAMTEPETISTVMGTDSCRIPYGFSFSQVVKEYTEQKKNPDAPTPYLQKWFGVFHRILQLRIRLNLDKYKMYLAIAVSRLDQDKIGLLDYTMEQFGIDRSFVKYMEYSESFFYYTYHQPSGIWQNQVALFRYEGDELECMILERVGRNVPQQIQMKKMSWIFQDKDQAPNWKKDTFLSACMHEVFQRHVISGVYMNGDDFSLDWMKDTKRELGSNRRAFMGQNLFTRGACFGASLMQTGKWNFVFQTDYKISSTLCIKARSNGSETILVLAKEGDNWFESSVSYEFMLRGSAELELMKQQGTQKPELLRPLKLTNLPARPDKTMRLSMSAQAIDSKTCRITVKDLGFGDFYSPSGRSWKFDVEM